MWVKWIQNGIKLRVTWSKNQGKMDQYESKMDQNEGKMDQNETF